MPQMDTVAVIDIGSNSVRLVVYDGLKCSPISLFNEKVLCALAEGLERTGSLSSDGKQKAERAIARFVALSQVMQVRTLFVFATSAVRDAKDGQSFVDRLSQTLDINIDILSGEDEARYAGWGVVSSISNTHGLVADLGGGSLEITPVNKQGVLTGEVSLPIGPLRFNLEQETFDNVEMGSSLDQQLGRFQGWEQYIGQNLYTVGGVFRNLAKVHMNLTNYPLRVLHNYKVISDDLRETLNRIIRMPESALQKITLVQRKRAKYLPYAALVLDKMIAKAKPEKITFSVTGVREGVLFEQLNTSQRDEDVLLAGCRDLIARHGLSPKYGAELFKWIQPIFGEISDRDVRLLKAICILSEIACFENTEYRAELAYRKVADSSLMGMSHKERIFIAKALYFRYSVHHDEEIFQKMEPLISGRRFQTAQALGYALRLARTLSGGYCGVLPHIAMQHSKEKLSLLFPKHLEALQGDAVSKRHRQLAEILGYEPMVG